MIIREKTSCIECKEEEIELYCIQVGSGNVILLYDEIIGYIHNPVLVITAQLINTMSILPLKIHQATSYYACVGILPYSLKF